MTISSHPWIKLLVAITAAIIVGIIFDSWGWGIATFFIFMFIFIWVAAWIFGSSIKGKVEVNDRLEELLNKLESIGTIKNTLPFNARGWCNSLGLYVQLREMANMTRLQAGEEHKSQIDALQDYSSPESIFQWKVKKYVSGDWEKLVNPTLDIANWLSTYGGLPKEYADSFNRAIQVFKKEGRLELPNIKEPPVSKAEVLEEMFRLPDVVRMGLLPSRKGFIGAEANVIIQKVNPLNIGAFPIKEEANEDQINEWLKHPQIDCLLPDDFIMSMASHTPLPVEMAERILRKLLQEKYDTYLRMAEERIRSRKPG